MGRLTWHKRLAALLRYDVSRFAKQATLTSHLRHVLKRYEIDLILDVGGNIGQYGNQIRDLGYGGDIVSFEPGSAAFAKLNEEAMKDSGWRAFNMALSSQTGEMSLHVPTEDVFSSFHPHTELAVQRFTREISQMRTEQVRVMRLDEFIDEHLPDFSNRHVLLKMDTQGHDLTVFQAAGKYTSQFAALQTELSVKFLYDEVPDYLTGLATYQAANYGLSGIFSNRRDRNTAEIIELDCVLVQRT